MTSSADIVDVVKQAEVLLRKSNLVVETVHSLGDTIPVI